MSFGKKLKNLRAKNQVTQLQLAAALKVSRSAISLYELDLREPDVRFLQKVSNYFNVSLDYIFGKQISNYPVKADKSAEDVPELLLIPILGKVPAGIPTIPVEDIEDYLPVPSTFIGKNQIVFALIIKGDSMIDIGINDGDTVLVKKQEVAENGQTVIARVNGEEVTCKRFYEVNNKVTLEPANSKYMSLEAKKVEIVGVVFKIIKDVF